MSKKNIEHFSKNFTKSQITTVTHELCETTERVIMANQEFVKKFEGSKSIGKKGEAVIKEFIENNWGHFRYYDMSEVDGYQYKEIDAVLENTITGEKKTIEIKTDTWSSSPNFAIETIANEELGRKGWLWTTESEWVVYYYINGLDSGEPNLWFLKTEDIRRVVRDNPRLKEYKAPQEKQVRREGWKTTKGVRVPRNLLKPVVAYTLPSLNITNPHSVQNRNWKP